MSFIQLYLCSSYPSNYNNIYVNGSKMVENLFGIYFSSEIKINIDMKFDQGLKHELFWNTRPYELSYQYLPVSVNGVFLFFCQSCCPKYA